MTEETAREIMSYRWILFKRKLSDDDKDDIMQDAILKLLQNDAKLESLIPAERILYIKRCINNSYVDIVRKRNSKRRNESITMSLPDYFSLDNEIGNALSTPPDVYAKIELKEVLEKASNHQFFQELNLFMEGYANLEIAEIKSQKLNTVLARIRYVRQFIKK